MEYPADSKTAFRVDQSQADFEREFFDQILKRDDRQPDVLRRQAELLARSGDYQSALPLDQRLAQMRPEDPVVHYNLACTLAMTDQASEAIVVLARALDLGYDDFAHIESDSDLDNLRDQPAFIELLQHYWLFDEE